MHPAHRPVFDELADHLSAVARRRPLIFIVNPGNWGDALIREGAERFLRKYDFTYAKVFLKDIEKGRVNLAQLKATMGHTDPVMVYNGSGAFTGHYGLLARVQKFAQHFSSAFFLPCTLNVAIDRNAFPTDTHFVVRDQYESMQACPDARFCHDMAFFLDLIDSPPVKNSGYFFREDGEAPSTKPQLPPAETNRDLSKFGRAQYPVDGFIRTIASYREIHTNRLHIGIAAALLGRQTYLSGNNYFKIRAIYKSSMEGTYPSVKFSDA